MLAGFVDGRGRKYDLNFRTLRKRLVDEEGQLARAEGESLEAEARCGLEIAVLIGRRSLPFLLPTTGELSRTSRRYVFVVAEATQRPVGQVSLLNVKLPLHPDAIAAFFGEQRGREYFEFEGGDVIATREGRGAIEVELRGPAPGIPGEQATYIARFSPTAAAREVLGKVL